jgi:hypothetical protein
MSAEFLTMKNQYFGDINDYLKYGLLRCFADVGLRIGVCWMLTPDDARSDGRKISYLSNSEQWRGFDPDLFDSLAEAITKGSRGVRHFQKSKLLPNASFCNVRVPDHQASRKRWLMTSLSKLTGVDLLFFDPDNGIEIKSIPEGKKGSSKYLYWDEIQLAWAQGFSLLIFQHFAREKRDSHIARLTKRLGEIAIGGTVMPFLTTNVVFLLAFHQRHAVELEDALKVVDERWTGKFRRR